MPTYAEMKIKGNFNKQLNFIRVAEFRGERYTCNKFTYKQYNLENSIEM